MRSNNKHSFRPPVHVQMEKILAVLCLLKYVRTLRELMVTMPVMVTFNEPVQNVNEQTLRLFSLDYDPNTQLTYENPVPATVYTSLDGGRVRATVQPHMNLVFGQKYKIVVTTAITDAVSNPSICDPGLPYQPPVEQCLLPLNRQYVASFTTKVPQVYDLTGSQFTDGRGIDLYTISGSTYAYVTAGEKGWYTVDVTDPTRPEVKKIYGTAGFSYRGVDVATDGDDPTLAITEDLRYADNSQYGYIRFYSLTTGGTATLPPAAAPKEVGREKLSEQFTGIPGRVSMLNNFAYVATVGAGLQVVDIKAAKAFMLTGKSSDGSTIVGGFDTVGQDYKQPTDIVAYKNGKAALSTTSGHLLLLDINIPEIPQLMKAFKPTPDADNFNYDSAWRVAVASDYAYTPAPTAGESAGEGLKVIDLAITSSMAGRIHTVDITDPYTPKVLGVTRDGTGSEVIATVSDITVSKASGLVYATAGMSVYIIDIKDPNNPVLLNIITQTPITPGSQDLTVLGASLALVEKDGWVYLASQQQGLRVLDLDPIELELEKLDPEYQSVRIYGADYYPALGTKAVNIWGVISGEAFNATNVAEWGLYLVSKNTSSIRVSSLLNGQCQENGIADNQKITDFTADESVKKGFAKVCLKWTEAIKTDMTENFTVTLQARKNGATTLNAATASKIYNFVFDVYHNGRVTLDEVISNRKIFVADGLVSASTGTFENTLGFDFVKELLNQVVPRKRNLVFNAADTNAPNVLPLPQIHGLYVADPKKYPYHSGNTVNSLIDEDGIFEKIDAQPKSPTSQALELFRRNFRIGNTKYNSPTDHDASRTMQKILKDYGSGLTNEQKAKLLYQVVDKETLVGNTKLITPENEAVTTANADVLINGTPGSGNDTGMYELYKNAVAPYIDRVIKEADRYAGLLSDTSLGQNPTDQWKGRNGEGSTDHGPAVSYSYGSKMSVDQFNAQVSSVCYPKKIDENGVEHKVEPTVYGVYVNENGEKVKVPLAASAIPTPANYLSHPTIVPEIYEGNLGDMCDADMGSKKYAGLKRNEFESSKQHELIGFTDSNKDDASIGYFLNYYLFLPPRTSFVFPQYSAKYWAGIDCSGLIQRTINSADALNIPGTKSGVDDLGNGTCNVATQTCLSCEEVGSQSYAPNYAYKIYDSKSKIKEKIKALSRVHKGDLVIYKGHVAMVHSDELSCGIKKDKKGKDNIDCSYEIIHAYGWDSYKPINEKNQKMDPKFSRKVIKMKNAELPTKTVPTGFGRIKLWN